MAFIRGANVVTDGLVLALDAANPKSYVSGSTIWNDLSGTGVTGSLLNGPTFSTDGAGCIVFDGSNDLCRVPNQTFNSTTNSSFTIEIFFKRNTSIPVNADSLYQMGTGTETNARIYFWFDNNNNGDMSINYYVNPGLDAYISIQSALFDTNFHQAVQVVNKSTALMTGYWDGVSKGSTAITANSSTSATNFDICGVNYCDATVAFVRIYKRALLPTEVLQNYNATKARFGIE